MADEDGMRPKAGATDAPPAGNGVDGHAATDEAEGLGAALEQEVVRLRAELTEVKDRWLRERADLENLKRRAVREKQDALRFGTEALLKDLLPIIDNFHRARARRATIRSCTGSLVLRLDEVWSATA